MVNWTEKYSVYELGTVYIKCVADKEIDLLWTEMNIQFFVKFVCLDIDGSYLIVMHYVIIDVEGIFQYSFPIQAVKYINITDYPF